MKTASLISTEPSLVVVPEGNLLLPLLRLRQSQTPGAQSFSTVSSSNRVGYRAKRDRTPSSLLYPLLAALALIATPLAPAQTTTPIPYTLTFTPATNTASLPALHSYCLANVSATQWLILGGRVQGLHQFNPSGNFAGPNTMLWSVNPVAGTFVQVADLSQINPTFGDPLTATNQQCEYQQAANAWYIVGGYGLNHTTNAYTTFPTIIRIPVTQVAAIANDTTLSAAQRQTAIAGLITNPVNLVTNPILQVTGGVLSHNASGIEFLSFGQDFEGNYNPFSSFTQTYTNQVQTFFIKPGTPPSPVAPAPFTIIPYGPYTSSDPTQPYNRRDFASAYDVDPTTGQERFAVFGGVFPPGKIAAYDFPVYITGTSVQINVAPDQTVHQHFGFYESPVVVVWDGSSIYHTFFGGIGHFFLNQSADQSTVYKMVTAQGRNDGLPFVEDIATLIQNSSGQYSEYISPTPIPANALHGASIGFIPNLGLAASHFQGSGESVINLASFQPGEQELIGYIYGGIEATFPLPCYPSHGTIATNTLYNVYLTRTPWPGLVPASQATEASGIVSALPVAETKAGPPSYTPPNPCATAPVGLTKQLRHGPKKPIKVPQQ